MTGNGEEKNVSEVASRGGSIWKWTARALCVSTLMLASLLLAGCSTGGITRQTTDETATAHVRLTKPQRIYLGDIDVTSGKWTAETDTPELHAKAKRLLEKYLFDELKEIAPTTKATGQETSGLRVSVTTVEADVNNIKGRVLWGVQVYPPKLVVRVKFFDLAVSNTLPVTVFQVAGNCYTYNPAIAGGNLFDDYFDKMSESIAEQTGEELRRLCR